ncbi:hypothetical protein N3K66_006741 [Trichothecium roseum]|uniref:Uncharacterized protein n=1 Tax=Trichothecium roseum TaxID=47278 RepID=A0ACC0UXF1_9HYPO|nr:hypothetical protein N3K66_006741 [Trichothecium roseum]
MLKRWMKLPPKPPTPPKEELEETFLKGSGPGGQKINKTNSAVQLKHIPTGIVVKCQETRSRDQNRIRARQLLTMRIDEHHNGDNARHILKAAQNREKAFRNDKKKRRKYRKLAEAGAEAADKQVGEEANEEVGKEVDEVDRKMDAVSQQEEMLGTTVAAEMDAMIDKVERLVKEEEGANSTSQDSDIHEINKIPNKL